MSPEFSAETISPDPIEPGRSPQTATAPKRPRIAILIAFFILIGAAVPLFSLVGPECHSERLLKTGTPAQGTILSIDDTGNRFNDQPQVRIRLTVEPPGGAPYETSVKMIISPVHLPQFQPGKRVKLRFDPGDPRDVAIEAVME
ncbi:DUF3592 domain-containing protein [bacterium]|nr:DUF3592 domain-containing protein [bacterium]